MISSTALAARAATGSVAAHATFEEAFGFYRDSGFLYPRKLAELEQRLPAIEQTWRTLLDCDHDVFRFVARRDRGRGPLRNAICAFAYAGQTWQGQHLVSAVRHEYAGTLAVLSELVLQFQRSGAQFARLSFRPTNPGTNRLFGAVAEQLPAHLTHMSVVDYGFCPVREFRPAPMSARDVLVRRAADGEQERAAGFFSRVLSAPEFGSLALDDLDLREIDERYRAHGLTRRRRVLLAESAGEVIGGCLIHDCSPGVNFSFLENAVEHLHIDERLGERDRLRVWHALARAAVAEVSQERDWIVVALDRHDRATATAARLVPPEPKQYAVLTVDGAESGFLRSIDCFRAYYDFLVARNRQRSA